MIINTLKKQGLIFLRNPQQLLLLILLPIILILILSFSLGGFMGGESVSIDAKVALIEKGNEQEEAKLFLDELEQSGLPSDVSEQIKHAAANIHPIEQLREDVFGSMKDMIELEVFNADKDVTELEKAGFTSVIEVPKDFTLDTLHYLFLDGELPGELNVFHIEDSDINTGVVAEILTSFQEQLTLSLFALNNGKDPKELLELDQDYGEQTTIENNRPIHSKEYYTIGMAVMNVLYIASAISSFAFMEKEKHIFNRIVLANVPGTTYFTGVFISGVLFGLIQLFIIFGFSWLVFGVAWPNIIHFLSITAALSLAVGAFSVLLTAITYRINSEATINLFGSMIVAIFALIGGSFFPIGDFSVLIDLIGDFTPNGAAMSAYIQLLRGGSGMEIYQHVIYLIVLSVLLLAISIYNFPKRGQIQ